MYKYIKTKDRKLFKTVFIKKMFKFRNFELREGVAGGRGCRKD